MADKRTAFAVRALNACPLFAHLSPERLHEIARTMSAHDYARGTAIFQQGDEGDALHVVESGVVKITADSAEGEEAILGEVRSGETFGELGLIDGAPRSATASAATDAVTLRLPRSAFENLLESDADFRRGVLIALSRELRRATRNLGELHFLDLAGRLASRLASLAREAEGGNDRWDAAERESMSRRAGRGRARPARASADRGGRRAGPGAARGVVARGVAAPRELLGDSHDGHSSSGVPSCRDRWTTAHSSQDVHLKRRPIDHFRSGSCEALSWCSTISPHEPSLCRWLTRYSSKDSWALSTRRLPF